MKIFICVVLATGVCGTAITRSLGQADDKPPSRIKINFSPPGLPPEAEAELSRVAGAYLKADKPANDAMKHAIALRDAGDLGGAVEECRKALSLSVKLNGHTFHPEAYQLLGELALRQNRNEEALRQFKLWKAERDSHKGVGSFSPFGKYSNDATVELDMALAYCQRGSLQLALNQFSDEAMAWLPPPSLDIAVHPEDWPGTRTLAALKATILLDIAYNRHSHARTEHAADLC